MDYYTKAIDRFSDKKRIYYICSDDPKWCKENFIGDKVTITAILKSNLKLSKQFDMYIKRTPDNEKLKTSNEIMNEIKNGRKPK